MIILLDIVLTVLASLWRSHRYGLEFHPVRYSGARVARYQEPVAWQYPTVLHLKPAG